LPKEKILFFFFFFVVDTIYGFLRGGGGGSFPAAASSDILSLETEDLSRRFGLGWERLIPGHSRPANGRLGTKKDAQVYSP